MSVYELPDDVNLTGEPEPKDIGELLAPEVMERLNALPDVTMEFEGTFNGGDDLFTVDMEVVECTPDGAGGYRHKLRSRPGSIVVPPGAPGEFVYPQPLEVGSTVTVEFEP